MKIILTQEESEKIFHSALCNGHGLAYCGLEITYNQELYKNAKESLQERGESICLEDVWMEILRINGTLTLVDNESGEDDAIIKLSDVHKKVQKTDIRHLMDAINETDDAITAEVILQTVFYGEVIFG
jgi:hypothetical protein